MNRKFWEDQRDLVTDTSHLFGNNKNQLNSKLVANSREKPMMVILDNETVFIPQRGGRRNIVQGAMIITYDGDIPDGFVEIEYLQTVYTNYPSGKKDAYTVDGAPNNKDIFYHQEGVDRLDIGEDIFEKHNLNGKYKFFDFPQRTTDEREYIYWRAELSLVGIREDGSSKIFETLIWGFSFESQKQRAINITPEYSQPSYFQKFVLNNRWMFQK